jgi:hypothetical protein
MPREPIAVFVESGLYIQNLTFEPLGAAVTDFGSSKLVCLYCSRLPAPPLYKLIPLLGLVCRPGIVVVVVVVVVVVAIVAVAGKAPESVAFFQTSFFPDATQTYFVNFTVFAKPIFLQLLADVKALVGIAGKTASKTIAIEIFSGRETMP